MTAVLQLIGVALFKIDVDHVTQLRCSPGYLSISSLFSNKEEENESLV